MLMDLAVAREKLPRNRRAQATSRFRMGGELGQACLGRFQTIQGFGYQVSVSDAGFESFKEFVMTGSSKEDFATFEETVKPAQMAAYGKLLDRCGTMCALIPPLHFRRLKCRRLKQNGAASLCLLTCPVDSRVGLLTCPLYSRLNFSFKVWGQGLDFPTEVLPEQVQLLEEASSAAAFLIATPCERLQACDR